MATLDDSPSLFTGQTWDVWDEAANNHELEGDDSVEESHDLVSVTDSMKLQRQDMNLFGFCPSQDEFFLVVCDNCGQVVKPQALQAHIETRHKYSLPKLSPIPATAASQKSPASATRSPTPSSKSSNSGKGPPFEENVSKTRTLDAKTLARSRTSPAKCRKSYVKLKKNHSLPVVKVERIPSPMDRTVSVLSDKKPLSPFIQPVVSPRSPLIQPVTPVPSPGVCVKSDSPLIKSICSPAPTSPVPVSPVTTPLPSPVQEESRVRSPVVRDGVEETAAQLSAHEKEFVVPVSPEIKPYTPPPRLVPSPVPSPVSAPPVTSPPLATSSDDASMTSPALTRPDPRTVPVPKKRYISIPKQEKLLPCKDREYDPDKHCGVWIADLKKHCTRSLTCKTHALSLRRAVHGRSADFDTLLDNHRTAKEEILRAKAEANGMPFVPSKAATKSAMRKAENERKLPKLNGLSVSFDKTRPVISPLSVSTSSMTNLSVSSPPRILQKATKLAVNNKLHKPLFSPPILSLPGKEATPPPELSSRLSSDGEEESGQPVSGLSFIKFHPRPAASCTFNARLSGHALVFNRKQDLLRSAFSQAIDKHLHPPPHKKLCVESKLPRETTPNSASKDPYEFIFVNSPHSKAGSVSAPGPSLLVTANPANATPIHTTSLLTQNHLTTIIPNKFVVQKSASLPKKAINRTIKPKDAKLKRSVSSPGQPISISIPNTLTLGSVGNMHSERNNVAVPNGQFLSLSSMAELQNNIHLHSNDRKKPKGSSILTCLPSGTFVVENKSQLGGGSVVLGGQKGVSSPQHVRPSPTASPLLQSGTVSPQIATSSPVSNGIVPSPSSIRNVSYNLGGGHGTPSPVSVGSPSPSYTGSAGEEMSPLHHHSVHSIVNHNLLAKSRPHKPNSRPPGGHISPLVQPHLSTNNSTNQPPRIVSALPSSLYSSQLVARSKVGVGGANKQGVAIPFVTSPGQSQSEPPLKRARTDLRLHHQNSPNHFISQHH